MLEEIKNKLKERYYSATIQLNGHELVFTVYGDEYYYDFRQCGEFVALDGVVMIPDAELIVRRMIATKDD